MRSELGSLKALFRVGRSGTKWDGYGVFQHPYTGALRRGEQAGLRALDGARKCQERLAGETAWKCPVGLVARRLLRSWARSKTSVRGTRVIDDKKKAVAHSAVWPSDWRPGIVEGSKQVLAEDVRRPVAGRMAWGTCARRYLRDSHPINIRPFAKIGHAAGTNFRFFARNTRSAKEKTIFRTFLAVPLLRRLAGTFDR